MVVILPALLECRLAGWNMYSSISVFLLDSAGRNFHMLTQPMHMQVFHDCKKRI